MAQPPSAIKTQIEKEKKEIKDREEAADQAIDQLKSMTFSPEYSIPRIRFVEERNILDHLYKQADIWNKSLLDTKTQGWGFQDHTFTKTIKNGLIGTGRVHLEKLKSIPIPMNQGVKLKELKRAISAGK